ncbi:hypothetical protein C1645_873024 [Glomus cerebriforme]|uniref:Uncharacterized protein n=1 Tax=Glomus cerebriforme TaxID=658196 RepID=A0A397TB06_9GLOM|nr:hypothetical protein C1645_873024 [Glomus cerebriforme]
MVTNQNHSSDSTYSEQEAIRHTEKIAKLLGTDKQNAEIYITLSGENRALKKQLEDYYSQHNTLERRVKRLERDVGSLKVELEDLDECVDRETVSFKESDLVEIIEIREKKAVPHKQQRRMRPRKINPSIPLYLLADCGIDADKFAEGGSCEDGQG